MTSRIRVLHVDDDPAFADLTASALERESEQFTVETASSADDGLDRFGATDYDCVVSDYDMPGMDGIEFLRAVRESYPDLPFILFTGKGSEEVASDAISAGVTDYLRKGSGTDQYELLANRITNAVSQVRAERQLERQNTRLRALFEHFPEPTEAYTYRDGEPYVADVNEAFTETFGYERETAVGSHIDDLVVPPDRREEARRLDDRVRAGDRIDEELRRQTADGLADFRLRNIRLPDDEHIDGYAVYADITEHKERERELTEQTRRLEELTSQFEEQYRHLFEEAPVMAVVTRAEDGKPVIEDCNQLFAERLGYEKASLVGRNLAELYTTESEQRLFDEGGYDRALSGQFMREERTLVTADGETVETLLRAVPREDAREETDGTLAMYIDISTRRDVERENARLEEFIDIISHDLRNPLNVAESYAELAAEDCNSEYLGKIQRAHERMETLIEDLLEYARSGQRIETTEAVALADVASQCWEGITAEDVTLSVETDRSVRANRGRVYQLIENLLRNAVEHGSTSSRTQSDDPVEGGSTSPQSQAPGDATDHGGPDTAVTVGDLPDGFYVEDTGPGIHPADREEVFTTGYSTSQEGTGFGLNIVQQVAEAHGWQVRVTEGSTGGARFEITGVETID